MSGPHIPEHLHQDQTGNETISQLAQRHLRDRSHTTTDEELRNAKIELSEIITVNNKNLYTIRSFTINSLRGEKG